MRLLMFVSLLLVMAFAGWYGSYINRGLPDQSPKYAAPRVEESSMYVKVFYPYKGSLRMGEKKVELAESRRAVARLAAREFLMGPSSSMKSYMPDGVDLLGVYIGDDEVLYLDFSGELRSEFQGDALSEFLALRGLYETMMANVSGLRDVKVLIEGTEQDSLGGHITLVRPIGESVSQRIIEGR